MFHNKYSLRKKKKNSRKLPVTPLGPQIKSLVLYPTESF
nr:MAG TPA: hypothetical protein [Bacteriophage sp.]